MNDKKIRKEEKKSGRKRKRKKGGLSFSFSVLSLRKLLCSFSLKYSELVCENKGRRVTKLNGARTVSHFYFILAITWYFFFFWKEK